MRLLAILSHRLNRPKHTSQTANANTNTVVQLDRRQVARRKSPSPKEIRIVRTKSTLVLLLLLIAIEMASQIRKTIRIGSQDSVGQCGSCVSALRMINLDAPQTALTGDTIKLSCFYSLTTDVDDVNSNLIYDQTDVSAAKGEAGRYVQQQQTENFAGRLAGEILYATKWYKEDREFFRYLAQEWPHKQALPLDGVQVDVNKSDNRSVVLKSVSLQTSGLYKCEVSTDAPNFITKSIERKLSVYSLPSGGPQIESGGANHNGPTLDEFPSQHRSNTRSVSIGERIELQCVAPHTKPATRIDWVINESLNLSAIAPIDSRGSPLFGASYHRYTRLPLQPPSADHLLETAPSKLPWIDPPQKPSRKHNSSSTNHTSPTKPESSPGQSASAINQRSHDIFADFEIIEQKPQGASRSGSRGPNSVTPIRAVPKMQPATMPSPLGNLVLPTITLSSRTLDQLLEQSTSTLNFTIDSDLMQLLFGTDRAVASQTSAQPITDVDTNLREEGGRHKPRTRAPSEILAPDGRDKRQSLGHSVSSDMANLQSPTNSNKTITTAAHRRRSGSGYIKGDTGSGLAKYGGAANKAVIHVKCVARVLNLNMFDEIRMVVQLKSTNRQDRLIKNKFSRPPMATSRKSQLDNDKNSAPSLNLKSFAWFVTFFGMLLILGL